MSIKSRPKRGRLAVTFRENRRALSRRYLAKCILWRKRAERTRKYPTASKHRVHLPYQTPPDGDAHEYNARPAHPAPSPSFAQHRQHLSLAPLAYHRPSHPHREESEPEPEHAHAHAPSKMHYEFAGTMLLSGCMSASTIPPRTRIRPAGGGDSRDVHPSTKRIQTRGLPAAPITAAVRAQEVDEQSPRQHRARERTGTTRFFSSC
ncbi:hypothetical protein B0H16DRAFT_822673 [Mycena metata]|uniref:Uncharacterized protein n=1 Tax=Mycena metata TaxID=1033252 RepID=A0AAD7IZC0_9AGAR|nr:hypothetical protein B0H16DRAFT_822673 [Mycena metata]